MKGAGGISSNEFSIRADFGVRITPLVHRKDLRVTNALPYLQDYYSYEVPASNVLGVTFTVTAQTGDVDLYAIRAPKLPGKGQADYESINAGATNETLIIHLDSQPVPLSPGLWYLAVTNVSGIPGVAYTINATEQRGRIRELIPGQRVLAEHTGIDDDFYYVTVPTNAVALRVNPRGDQRPGLEFPQPVARPHAPDLPVPERPGRIRRRGPPADTGFPAGAP